MNDLTPLIEARNFILYQWALMALGVVLVLEAVGRWRARLANPAASADTSASPWFERAALRWHAVSERLWWPVLFGCVVVLRVVSIDRGPLWYDEAFTVWLTRLPFMQVINAAAGDVHPPLYFALAWVWANAFGTEPFTVRLLSALLSIASFPVLKAIATELKLSSGAQCVGLLIFAVARFQIFYATDARMYALLQLLVLLSVWGIFKRRWAVVCVAWALNLWAHNYGVIFAASTGLWALWREWRNPAQVKRLLSAGGLAVLGFMPWVAVLAAQIGQVKQGHWIWPVTPAEVLMLFYTLLFNNGPLMLEGVALLGALALMAFVSIKLMADRPSAEVWVLTWLTLGPVLITSVVSLLVVPILVPRYLLPVGAFWALLIGWAVTHQVSWPAQTLMALVAVPLLVIGAFHPDRVLQLERGRPTEIAEFIQANWQAGDVILHLDVWTFIEGDQYLRGLPQYLYPQISSGLNVGGLSARTRGALGIETADAATLKAQYQRVWVIDAFSPIMPPAQRATAWRDLAQFLVAKRESWLDRDEMFGVEVWEARSGR